MEEAELLKDRLHAITEKRRVQEEINQKKLEIDKEKLSLQHLKKKALREQWLMDGSTTQNAQQRHNLLADQQQTRQLQLNIHRIEKEIEALEREESIISTNESFILKRLKAVEKSSEDIIKEAKENFRKESVISPVPPASPFSYSPLDSRPVPDGHTDSDQPKQTLFAMEINVQKDLRTGESRVISTATVTPQELEQRGIKVYDDGRKCVYAMRCDDDGPGTGLGTYGVDELSPSEVEQLLREATKSKQQRAPRRSSSASRGYQSELFSSCSSRSPFVSPVPLPTSRGSREQSYYSQPSHRVTKHWQSHDHLTQEVHSQPEFGYFSSNHIPAQSFISSKRHQPTNGSGYRHRQSHTPSYSELYRLPPVDYEPAPAMERFPSPIYQDDPPYRILNAMPANQDASESVTAIFMGYQTAEDDTTHGRDYDGSLQAELVVIGDDDVDVGDVRDRESRQRRSDGGYRNYGYQPGRYGSEPAVNCNVNTSKHSWDAWMAEGQTDGQQGEGGTDARRGSGIRKMKRQKHCCSVM